MNLRPLGPEPVTGTVHAVRGDGKPSQALDDTRAGAAGAVEPVPRDAANGTDGSTFGEQVAADLRRTEFLQPEGLLPVAAVAKRLGVSASTVHAAINAGKLRAALFGSVRRVRPEDLDAYVRSRGAPRPPADEDWCTVADLIHATGLSRSQAYRLLARGSVPFRSFGGTRYIRSGDLSLALRTIKKRGSREEPA